MRAVIIMHLLIECHTCYMYCTEASALWCFIGLGTRLTGCMQGIHEMRYTGKKEKTFEVKVTGTVVPTQL